MNISNVKNCSFSSWYEIFRKVTIKSRIIPLQEEFIDYLLADGIILPEGSYDETSAKSYKGDLDGEDEDEIDWDESTAEEDKQIVSFPDLESKIKNSIEDLGGSVFPKLNWSAPKDAKWITASHTLQCSSLGEVLLLLKSSDFIVHDLTKPYVDCADYEENDNKSAPNSVQYELVLRRWEDINPGTEFRCFVKDNTLIGISQRDYTNYYEYIVAKQAQICSSIKSFFKENICGKFPDANFVFDVYQRSKDYLELIDFNPFGITTDALLFEWDELNSDKWLHIKEPEFRCVTSYNGIQPSPYRYYAMPMDVLEVSTGQDPYKMIDLLQLMNNTKIDDMRLASSSESEAEENAD